MPTPQWCRMAHGGGCGSCYVVDTAARQGIQTGREPELSSHDNETPHVPPPSIWPIGFAIGIACFLVGLVVSTIVAVIGAAIGVVFGFLWVRDITAPVRAGHAAAERPPEPVSATGGPAAVEGKAALPV